MPLSEWQPLFAVQAGAAATLTGLVFIALSINLTRILSTSSLPGRAAESLVQFLQVFFVCTAGMIPGQSATALAIEIIAIALLSWIFQAMMQIHYSRFRSGHPLRWLITRILQTNLASIPLVVAGVFLFLGWPAGVYWLVPAFAVSFIAGVANAWVLLVEILR